MNNEMSLSNEDQSHNPAKAVMTPEDAVFIGDIDEAAYCPIQVGYPHDFKDDQPSKVPPESEFEELDTGTVLIVSTEAAAASAAGKRITKHSPQVSEQYPQSNSAPPSVLSLRRRIERYYVLIIVVVITLTAIILGFTLGFAKIRDDENQAITKNQEALPLTLAPTNMPSSLKPELAFSPSAMPTAMQNSIFPHKTPKPSPQPSPSKPFHWTLEPTCRPTLSPSITAIHHLRTSTPSLASSSSRQRPSVAPSPMTSPTTPSRPSPETTTHPARPSTSSPSVLPSNLFPTALISSLTAGNKTLVETPTSASPSRPFITKTPSLSVAPTIINILPSASPSRAPTTTVQFPIPAKQVPTNAPAVHKPTVANLTWPTTSAPFKIRTLPPNKNNTPVKAPSHTSVPSHQPSLSPTSTDHKAPNFMPSASPPTPAPTMNAIKPVARPLPPPTMSPTVTQQPSLDVTVPTSLPTNTPLASPTRTPTMRPTIQHQPPMESSLMPSVDLTYSGGPFSSDAEFRENLRRYFQGLSGPPIGEWNVSGVTDFSDLFGQYASSGFNEDISGWDVSSATTLSCMFCGADRFDKPLNSWNTANVQSMSSMFYAAYSFDQDISPWNVSKVQTMNGMFGEAALFNQNLSPWSTSNLMTSESMFTGATVFNGDLSSWDTSRVTAMRSMFSEAVHFDRDISMWDVSEVQDFSYMFEMASAFNQNLCAWGDKAQSSAIVLLHVVQCKVALSSKV